ncbi:hypothetical protein JOF56_011661 [Kibdelosporangium banguiense]|uniref:CsbD family protein n=1 Tax=Kibdelosporangium banguiense TaxID=1365924 RepID=A0ABS4U3R3_9PSEU|nr:hypothetical protein [Kibdelosporangium banguiense]MBP2331276.1 hypothetical protein [Kibdelosporangium banguiense]
MGLGKWLTEKATDLVVGKQESERAKTEQELDQLLKDNAPKPKDGKKK